VTQPASTWQARAQAAMMLADRAAAIPTFPETVAVLPPLSATWIVNAKFPALVGVPDTVPSLPSVRPSGNAPALIDHE